MVIYTPYVVEGKSGLPFFDFSIVDDGDKALETELFLEEHGERIEVRFPEKGINLFALVHGGAFALRDESFLMLLLLEQEEVIAAHLLLAFLSFPFTGGRTEYDEEIAIAALADILRRSFELLSLPLEVLKEDSFSFSILRRRMG